MRIAIIGSDGLPARYGGFETFVEQIAPRFAELGHDVLVVGSSVGRSHPGPSAEGLTVVNLPIRANGPQSVLFDLWSFWRVRSSCDCVLLLGVSAGLFLPLMKMLASGRRISINVDGLESRRAKWRGLSRIFLSLSERVAIATADSIICDNRAIADIVLSRFDRSSVTIAYGNDHVVLVPPSSAGEVVSTAYGLNPHEYMLSIARIEPENHIAEMIEGFLRSSRPRYAIVGNFSDSRYGLEIKERLRGEGRVLLIDSTYDPVRLGALRTGCAAYLHGHGVGGTNPSLVEMLPYIRPIIAFSCPFNRSTLRGSCGYFGNVEELSRMLDDGNLARYAPPMGLVRAPQYEWRSIASAYVSHLASIRQINRGE